MKTPSGKKTVLILVDGMRPDSFAACGNPFVNPLLEHSVHTLNAQTVMPSVTLPCHMSLFHSVAPDRHGITTNTYVPQVRPVRGICEVLRAAGKNCAMFYNWEELKDLSRPDSLCYANYVSGHVYTYPEANRRLTENAISFLKSDAPDFAFLYLGWTDAAGHGKGWMSPEYLESVNSSFDNIAAVCNAVGDDYIVAVTADHGGHNRSHGTDMPEDMTIPLAFYNPAFASRQLPEASILDIAPTLAAVLGVNADPDWEGKVLDI